MHFIDFVLQLIYFVCFALKTIYIFSFDYLIPVIGHVLPVLTKYLSQLFSFLLRIFFTYISPCIIQILMGTTFICTKLLNWISVASMAIIESDVNLEYAHAIIMISLLVFIIYFHITQRIAGFFYEWYRMLSLYLRVLLNIIKMLRFCFSFVYKKIASLLFGKQFDSDDEVTNVGIPKRHHTNSNGTNGSARRIKQS